jgi:hypothetical protein
MNKLVKGFMDEGLIGSGETSLPTINNQVTQNQATPGIQQSAQQQSLQKRPDASGNPPSVDNIQNTATEPKEEEPKTESSDDYHDELESVCNALHLSERGLNRLVSMKPMEEDVELDKVVNAQKIITDTRKALKELHEKMKNKKSEQPQQQPPQQEKQESKFYQKFKSQLDLI